MAIIRGTDGADRLSGTPAADTILGRGGDDRLFGENGNDFLTGGRGNDRSFGGAGSDLFSDGADGADGNDLFDGGAGIDRLDYRGNGTGVNLTLGTDGTATLARQGREVDTVRGVENVDGSVHADGIVGNNLANVILGHGGSDRLEGRGGNDRLLGGFSTEDDATLVIDGGAGNDFINGGRGSAARLIAGTGSDRVFASTDARFEPPRVDFVDLGQDSDKDVLLAFGNLDPEADRVFGFGVDRVANFRAADGLSLQVFVDSDVGRFNAGDLLDSNGDGRISGADQDVRQVGRDLLLDIDALLDREGIAPLPGGDQHIVLQNLLSFDADQLI